jgi:hypothetical protein
MLGANGAVLQSGTLKEGYQTISITNTIKQQVVIKLVGNNCFQKQILLF